MSQYKQLISSLPSGMDPSHSTNEMSENWLFDPQFYLFIHKDVARSNLDPLQHFLRYGAQEKRSPHILFDSNYYFEAAPAPGKIGNNPIHHFLNEGYKKGFNPHPFFDIA